MTKIEHDSFAIYKWSFSPMVYHKTKKSNKKSMNSTIFCFFFLMTMFYAFSAYTQDILIKSGTTFHSTNLSVFMLGNVTVETGTNFTSNTSARIYLKKDLVVNSIPLIISGSLNFSNDTLRNVSGQIRARSISLLNGSRINLAGSGNLIASDSLKLNGTVKTNSNRLEIGTSTSNIGSLEYFDGYIDGNILRWFSNSLVNDVLFPFGSSNYYAPGEISFTTAPTTGGALLGKHTMNLLNPMIPVSLIDGVDLLTTVSEMNIWQFDETNSLSGGNYSMALNTNLIYGVSDPSVLRIVKRPSNGGLWSLNGNHVLGSGSPASPIVSRSEMSNFSQFAIASPTINPLSVVLNYLNTQCDDTGVLIKWQTASEYNSDYFILERSFDGVNWEIINKTNAAGNSSSIINYSVLDDDRLESFSTYRLSQVDFNGLKTVYTSVSSNCSFDKETILIYPNPTEADVSIQFNSTTPGDALIRMYSSDGKLSLEMNTKIESGSTTIGLDLSGKAKGVYQLMIKLNEKITFEKLFIH